MDVSQISSRALTSPRTTSPCGRYGLVVITSLGPYTALSRKKNESLRYLRLEYLRLRKEGKMGGGAGGEKYKDKDKEIHDLEINEKKKNIYIQNRHGEVHIKN